MDIKYLIDFVDFNKKTESQFHLRISSLIRTTPITTNPDSDGESVQYYYSDQPEQFHRISSSYLFGENQTVLKTGMIFKQNMGETKNIFTDKKFIELGYLPIYDTGIRLDRIIIGNFTASFGQGVIIESTDYFSPRRSGYGYSKRNDGVKSDITRSSQYVLNGVALQLSSNWMRLSYFRSKSPRDAIINKDLEIIF